MFTVLLLFLQLISSTSHPTPIGFDQCTLDLETLLLNTTTIPNGPDILSAWGLGQGDLGSYSICATYEQQKYHYCWMGTDITRAIGLCVPATCTQKVLLRNIDVIVDVVEHLKYNASLDIFKAGCTQLEPFDTSAYITSISIATLVLIFTVSSIASWRKRCFTCMERGCDCVGQRNPFASNASNNNVSTLDYWNLGWSQHAPGIENSPAATTMTWNNEQTMEQGVDSGGAGEMKKPNQQNSDSDGGISPPSDHYSRSAPITTRRPSRPTVPPYMLSNLGSGGSGGSGDIDQHESSRHGNGPNQSDSDTEQHETKRNGLDEPLLSPASLLPSSSLSRGNGNNNYLMHDHVNQMNSTQQSNTSLNGESEENDSCLLKVTSIVVNSFSLKQTWRQLCAKDRRPLSPLHALRVLATLWVILGNIVVYMMPVIRNLPDVEYAVTHSWTSQVILSSVLANDCFLVLGGFFAGHSFLVRLKAVNRKSAFADISNLRYGCIDVPRMYASRLVRILPTYGLVLASLITISGKLNPGPLHSVFQNNAVEPCRELWWSNILLINNLYPQTGTTGSDWYSAKACMSWTWYLAVDWELYIISPIFVMLYWKHRKIGWIFLVMTLLGAIGVQIWLAMHFHYSMNPFHYLNTIDEYHTVASIKPYTRCVPYLMGLGAAMIFHNEAGRLKRGSGGKKKIRNRFCSGEMSLPISPETSGTDSPPRRSRNNNTNSSRSNSTNAHGNRTNVGSNTSNGKENRGRYRDVIESSKCVLFGFVASITSILFVVFIPATDYLGASDHKQPTHKWSWNNTDNEMHHYSPYHTVISNWSDFGSVLYAVLSHVVLGLAMTFIVLAFSLGHGGWLRELAKAQLWQPLSRLTFGVYLVHPMLIFFTYTSSLDLIYFQPLTVLTNFISLTILAFLVAFVLFILVTLPCSRMGRALIWGVQIGHHRRSRSGMR